MHPPTPDLLGSLTVLLDELLPDETPENIQAILEMRCHVPENPVGDLVSESVAEDIFPKDDLNAFEDFMDASVCYLYFFLKLIYFCVKTFEKGTHGGGQGCKS